MHIPCIYLFSLLHHFTLSRGGRNNCSLTSEQWSSQWPPSQSPLGNTLGKELPLPSPSLLPHQVLYVSPFPVVVSFLPPCLCSCPCFWLPFYSYLSFKTMSLGPPRSWCEYRVKYSIIFFFFFVRRNVQMKRNWEKLEKIGRDVWPQSKETGREGWMEATEQPPCLRKTQWSWGVKGRGAWPWSLCWDGFQSSSSCSPRSATLPPVKVCL